jgi:hypothetical protein
MICPHCGKSISLPMAKGFMRGSYLLKSLHSDIKGYAANEPFSVRDFPSLQKLGTKKQIYNAFGYLARHGAIVKVGYVRYVRGN